MCIATHQLQVLDKVSREGKGYVSKTTSKFLETQGTISQLYGLGVDDVAQFEIAEHNEIIVQQTCTVPVAVLSPTVAIIWMY